MRRRYLLGYDIRDEVRLRRVHDLAKAHGYALQYSMFVCDLDRGELAVLRNRLSAEIKIAEDSIVIVDLGEPSRDAAGRFSFLGVRPSIPEGGATIV